MILDLKKIKTRIYLKKIKTSKGIQILRIYSKKPFKRTTTVYSKNTHIAPAERSRCSIDRDSHYKAWKRAYNSDVEAYVTLLEGLIPLEECAINEEWTDLQLFTYFEFANKIINDDSEFLEKLLLKLPLKGLSGRQCQEFEKTLIEIKKNRKVADFSFFVRRIYSNVVLFDLETITILLEALVRVEKRNKTLESPLVPTILYIVRSSADYKFAEVLEKHLENFKKYRNPEEFHKFLIQTGFRIFKKSLPFSWYC